MPWPLRLPTAEDVTSRRTSSAASRAIGRAVLSRLEPHSCPAIQAASSAARVPALQTIASTPSDMPCIPRDASPKLHRAARCNASRSFLLRSNVSSCCHQWFKGAAQFFHCAEYCVLGRVLFHFQDSAYFL